MNPTLALDNDLIILKLMMMKRCSAAHAPYRTSLGLSPEELSSIIHQFFPDIADEWREGECFGQCLQRYRSECCARHDGENLTPNGFKHRMLVEEESDLYRLFLDHRSSIGPLAFTFARIIARACMEPEHLWMCLGLKNRDQLSALLRWHFRPLFEKNTRNMRWKKFFYKQLCDIANIRTCKASACEICAHYGIATVTRRRAPPWLDH